MGSWIASEWTPVARRIVDYVIRELELSHPPPPPPGRGEKPKDKLASNGH